MKRSNLAISLYVALVFASGTAVGVLGQRLYSSNAVSAKTRSAEEFRSRYVEEMRSRLQLSDAQVGQLQVILDETRSKFRAVREKSKPELRAIDEERVGKINGMLDAKQRDEYQKMRSERERRQRERDKDKPGC